MDDKDKPFDIVSIVILVMIGLANDAAEIVFDLLAATVAGLPGEAIMKPIDFIVDFILAGWFFFKLGFGGPFIIQAIGDLLEPVGLPTRTITVVWAIWTANHPKSIISKTTTAVATVEGGGAAGGEAAEGAEMAGEIGAGAEEAGVAEAGEEVGASEETSVKEKMETEEEGGAEGPREEREKSEREKEIEEELTPEEEKNPLEVESRKLNEGPDEDLRDDETDEDDLPSSPKKPAASERSARNSRPKLQDIKDINNSPLDKSDDDETDTPAREEAA
jgi:hypothetical protein